jgi:Zn-dependent protease
MPRARAVDGGDMNGSHALALAARRPIPITIGPSAVGLAVMLAAAFAVFSLAGSLPVASCVLLGGIGGPVSLLFHELGHARAAQRLTGISDASISLVWLGAATRLEGRYETGREQARVAIAGPQASFLLALALLVPLTFPVSHAAKEGLLLLALFNVLVGLLNLFPAHPLDGHKVVVGLLWSVTGSEPRARRIVRRAGLAWLAVELVSCAALVAARPGIGVVVSMMALAFLVQKHFVGRVRA